MLAVEPALLLSTCTLLFTLLCTKGMDGMGSFQYQRIPERPSCFLLQSHRLHYPNKSVMRETGTDSLGS